MEKKEKFELKHHKDFHRIQFQDFKTKERKLIFALCYKLMEQESDIIEFNVKEIAEISGYRPTKAGDNIYKSLEETYKRIKNASIKVKKENGVKHFVLFTVFETFEDKGLVKIRVNDEYRYLLNQITAPFTIQDVIEYRNLNSGYSQLLYSILKEWEKKKECVLTIEDFRKELGIPIKYRISEIDKFVLTPIMTELPQYFFNLKLEKIKTGRRVISLKFTWNGKQKEAIDIKEAEVVEIEISEQLNKAIEKAKKNRFIEKLLTLDNIEILTQMFQENDLVKGLLWAYKEVKQDISTLNYLIKTIRTGAEQKEIKIKVKESKNKEVIQEALFDEKTDTFKVDPVKKEKISQEKYEELYKGYLKENNIAHNRGTRLGFDKLYENKYEIIETPKEKIYTINELPKEKLLSKAGKELKGVALLMRLRKIAEEMKVSIEYNSEIIKGV